MKSRRYPAFSLPEFSEYKLVAVGGKVYRNIAAKPDALLMIIVPDPEANEQNARF